MLKSIFSMRSVLSALLLAGATMQTPAHAQQPRGHVVVDVPFSFQAGSRHFAPGHYDLTLPNLSMMTLASKESFGQAMVLWNQSIHPAAAPKVLFHRYGNEYFLRQVWLADRQSYLSLPESKAERVQRLSMRNVAAVQPANHDVELAQATLPR